TVLFPLLPQILPRDSERFGGPLHVAVELRQRALDVRLFCIEQCHGCRGCPGTGGWRCRRSSRGFERREMLHTKLTLVRKDHGALDDVAQLADVAGPTPCAEPSERRRRDAPHVLLELAAEELAKVLGEHRQVALDLPQ